MSRYTAFLTKKAQKQLDGLSDKVAKPIIDAIVGLEENPRPAGYKKLKEREGFRIRTGNYRIIYDIWDQDLHIEIITLGHRKDIYK